MRFSKATAALGAALLTCHAGTSVGAKADGYGFEAAAQEITQLYWLAETATACGWTTAQDAGRFKAFSMRFLGAHLSERHRHALQSMVNSAGYEERLRKAAAEAAADNCRSNRWHVGWITYKAAADEHDGRY